MNEPAVANQHHRTQQFKGRAPQAAAGVEGSLLPWKGERKEVPAKVRCLECSNYSCVADKNAIVSQQIPFAAAAASVAAAVSVPPLLP